MEKKKTSKLRKDKTERPRTAAPKSNVQDPHAKKSKRRNDVATTQNAHAEKSASPASQSYKSNYKSKKPIQDIVLINIKNHKDQNGGHPHAIMDNIDSNHVSVGFSTKKKKGKRGGTNYTLQKSIFDDEQMSYMRRQAIVAPISEYGKLRQGSMTPKDYERAKQYAEKAKQKYLRNKKSIDCQTLKEH